MVIYLFSTSVIYYTIIMMIEAKGSSLGKREINPAKYDVPQDVDEDVIAEKQLV